MFPSHEDVFTPIGPTVGVARIQGKDTLWALNGAGYELTSSKRALLPSVQTALDGAAADFRAYFVGDPPAVSVVALQSKRGQRPDTALLARIRATGAIPVFVRLGDQGRGLSAGQSGPDLVSVAPVVRAWVSAMASTPLAGSTAASTSSAGVPRWLEVSIPALIGGWSDADIVSAQIGMHPDRIISLRSVFSGQRPSMDTTAGRNRRADDPLNENIDRDDRANGRGGYPAQRRHPKDIPALSGGALWDAEALSITNYLATREGRPFIGTAARALMAGSTIDEVLAGARIVPRDVETLDRSWREWLATQAQAIRDSR